MLLRRSVTLKNTVSYVKKVYLLSPKKIIIMANNEFKVIIPRNTRDLIRLMKLIFKKHTLDGAASKIGNMEEMDWTAAGPKIDALSEKQDKVDELRRQAEKLQGEIDKEKEWMDEGTRATRDVLQGHYRSNPKALGDYGYIVNAASDANDIADDMTPQP